MFTGIEYKGYIFNFDFKEYMEFCDGIKRSEDKLEFIESMINVLQKPELLSDLQDSINIYFSDLTNLPLERRNFKIKSILQKLATSLLSEKRKILKQVSLDNINAERADGINNKDQEETPVKIRWLKQNTDLVYLFMALEREGFINPEPGYLESITGHFVDKDSKPFNRENLRKQKSNMLKNKKGLSKDFLQIDEIIGNTPSGQ